MPSEVTAGISLSIVRRSVPACVGGVSLRGLSTTMLEEASMIASMMSYARRVIVLADAAKFATSVFAHIANFDRMHVLVTDAEPPPDLAAALAESGVEVVVA